MENIVYRRYRVSVDVETAVHVWSSESYVADIDYTIRNNEFLLLDYTKVVKQLEDKGVSIAEAIASGEKLSSLITRYGVKIEDATRDKLCVPDTIVAKLKNAKEVRINIKTNNIHYIPGSELKGLIRTAILYYMVKNGFVDWKTISDQMDQILWEKKGLLMAGYPVEAILKKQVQYYRRGKPLLYIIDVLMYLAVTDPLELNPKPYVEDIVVIHRTNPSDIVADIFVEALSKGSSYSYEVYFKEHVSSDAISESISKGEINTNLYNNLIDSYKSLYREKTIFDALKTFSKDLINYEKNVLSGIGRRGYSVDEIVNIMEKWLDDVENNRCYYLKIGFGCGHYSKTVYLALPSDLREKLVMAMSKRLGRIWDHYTLRVLGSKYYSNDRIVEPFGWVKISFKEV